jgi:seryl-tRNA synthetase
MRFRRVGARTPGRSWWEKKLDEDWVTVVRVVAALNGRRKELIKEQQSALAVRKAVSADIGKLLREGRADEADKLKLQVMMMMMMMMMSFVEGGGG